MIIVLQTLLLSKKAQVLLRMIYFFSGVL